MTSPDASQEIRDAFGLFWRKKSGKRLPNDLKGVSFSNSTTFSTRVRLRLLKELCRKHQAANPSLSCFITSYLARPELKIRDRRGIVTSLTYTEAIQQLSQHLSLPFLQDLYQYAKTNLPEKEVPERFLILTPDLLLGSGSDQLSMSVDESQPPQPQALAQATNAIATISQPVSTQQAGTGVLTGSDITYASMAAQPPSTSSASLFQSSFSTPIPTQTTTQNGLPTPFQSHSTSPLSFTPAQFQTGTSSPTYAALVPVQVSPTDPLSGSFLHSAPSSGTGLGTTTGDDHGLVQRNRHRFAQKSAPYPPPT
jgi:hypothetical protein